MAWLLFNNFHLLPKHLYHHKYFWETIHLMVYFVQSTKEGFEQIDSTWSSKKLVPVKLIFKGWTTLDKYHTLIDDGDFLDHNNALKGSVSIWMWNLLLYDFKSQYHLVMRWIHDGCFQNGLCQVSKLHLHQSWWNGNYHSLGSICMDWISGWWILRGWPDFRIIRFAWILQR